MNRILGITLGGRPHTVHPYNHQSKTVLKAGKVMKVTNIPYTPAKARQVQKRSGQVSAQTLNRSRLNVTVRDSGTGGQGDPGYLYRQMTAVREQIDNSLSPGYRVAFHKAHARMVATDKLRTGNDPGKVKELFSSHPFVGINPSLDSAISLNTQATMALQRRYNYGGDIAMVEKVQQFAANHPTIGPMAKQTPIAYDGTNLRQQTIHHPDGRNVSRIVQQRDITGKIQWDREYKKGFTGSKTGLGVNI